MGEQADCKAGPDRCPRCHGHSGDPPVEQIVDADRRKQGQERAAHCLESAAVAQQGQTG